MTYYFDRKQKKLEMRRYRLRLKDPYYDDICPSLDAMDAMLSGEENCLCCGKFIGGGRQNRKYCSPSCKQRAYRERKKAESK